MNKNGTRLCVISLLCMYAAPVIIFIVAAGFMSGDISGATADAYGAMIPLDSISYIAAWVLAIVARAKYRNKFSLVLLILYGVTTALSIFGFVLIFLVILGAF